MFVERSSARISRVRFGFVVGGLMPFLIVVGWAFRLASTGHRAAVQHAVERVVGVPVSFDGVVHPLPGQTRILGCTLGGTAGTTAVRLESVDVEKAVGELRMRIGRIDASPEAVRLFCRLARQWLEEPVRFHDSWIIDIDEVVWSRGQQPKEEDCEAYGAVRIECVQAGASRGMRMLGVETGDEIRVLFAPAAEVASPARIEVDAQVARGIPWGVVREACGGELLAAWEPGNQAHLRGRLRAVRQAGQWLAEASGIVDRIDLAAATQGLEHRLTGLGQLDILSLSWQGTRLQHCEASFTARSITAQQGLFDALLSVVGCRAGRGHVAAPADRVQQIDDCGLVVTLDAAGVSLQAGAGRGGSLARFQGLSIVDEPAERFSGARLAWLWAPARSTPAVPMSSASAWLISVLPQSADTPQPARF